MMYTHILRVQSRSVDCSKRLLLKGKFGVYGRYNSSSSVRKPIHYASDRWWRNSTLASYQLQFQHFHTSHFRLLSVTSVRLEKDAHKPSSKVEVTVQQLKKQQKEKEAASPIGAAPTTPNAAASSSSSKTTASSVSTSAAVPQQQAKTQVEVVSKSKTIKQKIIDEIVHYYHGFRLLFIDMKISTYLVWRVLRGKSLTRREYRLLTRTVGDMFRLVPFSVFIIVPFMEFLLPVFIKFFPGMLPSTFQTAKAKEDKIRQNLKVKMEMAKFLQETLDDMSVQHKDRNSEKAKEFTEWFQKVRTSGHYVPNEEIMKFSKLFEDEITLDSLSRSQLIALCRVLDVQTLGTNNFLRFQLRMKLRSLAADDRMIQKEGVDALTLSEVQQACRARGMRAYGLTEERLRMQLGQWLDLSLNERVPPSLLLLSRALMLPETIPTGDKLKATISALPETVMVQTTVAIGEKEGKIDNRAKLQALKQEEKHVKEERKERREAEKKQLELDKKELLVDNAPILNAEDTPTFTATPIAVSSSSDHHTKVEKTKKLEHLEKKDVETLENALDHIGKSAKSLAVEKEELADLKAEMADYKEDVEDLKKVTAAEPEADLKVSKAARRLFNSVDRLIGKLDKSMAQLEEKEKELKLHLSAESTTNAGVKETEAEILKIDDIMAAIKQIKNVPDQSKMDLINKMLKKIDDDHDGAIKIEDVLKVIEIIGKEHVNLSDKQLDEVLDVLDKEEILEVEDKIEKALQKSKEPTTQEKTTAKSNKTSDNKETTSISGAENFSTTKSSESNQTERPLDEITPKFPPPPPMDKPKPKGNSKSL